jgi:[acyl-carrier-protein] S-malonyltransferase
MSKAFVFPGQGSQSVGMGKELADAFPQARAVFAEVDDALGQNLSGLMFDGPQEDLTLTANAQPALMASSLAVVRVLEAEAGLDLGKDAGFVAGHSLGEYSALAAAGSLSIFATAKLLRVRGEAMQNSVPAGTGAMAALLGLDFETAAMVVGEAMADAAEGEVCQIANDNGGGQIVISGTSAAVHRAIDFAKGHGGRRSIILPVSAPFHCRLMYPAAEAMTQALASAEIKPPCVPLVANVRAGPVTDVEEIRRLLVAQVTGTVRWRESLAFMAGQGVSLFVECGAGKVLSGLIKRVTDTASGLSVGTPADIDLYRAQA